MKALFIFTMTISLISPEWSKFRNCFCTNLILIILLSFLIFGCGENPVNQKIEIPDYQKNFKIKITDSSNTMIYEIQSLKYENGILELDFGDFEFVVYDINQVVNFKVY